MGNYRFKLSDMVPSSWIYKLKDMGRSSRNHGPKPKKSEPQRLQEYCDQQKSHQHSVPRKSYHFARDLSLNSLASPSDPKLSEARYFPIPNPPRRSTRRRRTIPGKSRKKKPTRLVSSSVSAGCSCRATLDSVWAKAEPTSLPETEFSATPSSGSDTSSCSSSVGHPPQLPRSFDQMVSWSTSCSCSVVDSGSKDIVIDVGKRSFGPEIDLPPIATRPLKFTDMVKNVRRSDSEEASDRPLSVKVVKEQQTITVNDHAPPFKPSPGVRGFMVSSPAVRLRISSSTPRIGPKQRTHHAVHRKCSPSASLPSLVRSVSSGNRRRRRSVSDSFAIVKTSADPKTDFRESMVEMIMENNIRASNDLEELLACYLSLNSDQYHDVIISVFKQIWFDLNDIKV